MTDRGRQIYNYRDKNTKNYVDNDKTFEKSGCL